MSYLNVTFYNKSNTLHIRIQNPGEGGVIDRPATDKDRHAYAWQWVQFERGEPQIPDGLPIDLLYPSNSAIAEKLRGMGVHTLEQCAHLSGHAIDCIGMGAQTWINEARRLLDNSNKGVSMRDHQRDIDRLEARIRSLGNDIAELRAKRGRVKV